jgi:hypothetical protein
MDGDEKRQKEGLEKIRSLCESLMIDPAKLSFDPFVTTSEMDANSISVKPDNSLYFVEKISKELDYSEQDINEFKILCHATKYKNCLVPDIIIGGPEFDRTILQQMFDGGLICWKTERFGILTSLECKNPSTGRWVSGYMYMTKKCVEKHFEALFRFRVCSGFNGEGETSLELKEHLLSDAIDLENRDDVR